MNNEINLIIRHFIDVKEGRAFTSLSFKQTMILLDYITNLQEENKKQEELISRLYSIIDDDKENFKLLEQEKDKEIDKVIDIINNTLGGDE